MSFTKIARENARREAKQKARRQAQLSQRYFMNATKLPARPETLMEAAYLAPLITIAGKEVLMVSPRAVMPSRANQ